MSAIDDLRALCESPDAPHIAPIGYMTPAIDELITSAMNQGVALHRREARDAVRAMVDQWSTAAYEQRQALARSLLGSEEASAPDPLSSYQREKIAKLPKVVAELRRNSRRGATKTAVAREIRIDRGTLVSWLADGIIEPWW